VVMEFMSTTELKISFCVFAATGPYPEEHEFSPYTHILLSEDPF
jgi:hypothetical protein